MADDIDIPHDWSPRPYQTRLFNRFGYGLQYQRAVAVWHRRAGKDSTGLNLTAREMFKRVGTYWHLFPEHAQSRRAIWNGIDREGRRIIDQFLPAPLRERTRQDEMMIELKTGSIWQMAGSDRYDSLVGSNPVGVVFSEYSLSDPAAWDYIRPILRENDGWALFIYTPRGRNHGYELFNMALGNDDWYAERLTINDTGVLTEEDIQAERESGMSENKILQEYYCDFDADTDEQFIPSQDVADARTREAHTDMSSPRVLGVDVARFGDDSTVIYPRCGLDARSMPYERYQGLDTMQVAGKVADAIERYAIDQTFIDEGAMGAGVIDRLRQLGYNVIGVNFGAGSDRQVEGAPICADKRTEMWATMRQAVGSGLALPDDELLAFELCGPEYDYNARNEIKLERKADMKKRGVRSPDVGDALALTYAYPVVARAMMQREEDRQVDEYDPFWS